ncbi:MAG: biotin--[acetyl-CoA-carboxylase] ligase [Nitrospina sp.]|nr:biotin--[acetyl-CoA-carboxylase] ligase [Nitrospina sp.]
MTSSSIDTSALEQIFSTCKLGHSIRFLPQIDSTNEEIRRGFSEGFPEGTVIIADCQTQGRGRQGRSWHSEAKAGLYISTLLKPQLPPDRLSCITLMAGVATASAIQQQTSAPIRLKWPNDILLNGKKLAGILCECLVEPDTTPAIIVGIGINLNHSHFPEEIRDIATSLKVETGKIISHTDLARQLLQNMNSEYEDFLQGKLTSLMQKWTQQSDLFGKTITVYHKDRSLTGQAIGLDLHGKLILQTPDGIQEHLDSGEVSFNSG